MSVAIPWKAVGALAMIMLGAGSAWQFQDWRCGRHPESTDHFRRHRSAGRAPRTRAKARGQRENPLRENDQCTKSQARLRDRLATSDLRLSVLLAEDPVGGDSVPAGNEAVGVVHGAARARLDPEHAQRIIRITDSGDRGLIALAACQAYVREVTR